MHTQGQTVTVGLHVDRFGCLPRSATVVRHAALDARPMLGLTRHPVVHPTVRSRPGMGMARASQCSLVMRASRHDPEGGRMRG